MRSLLGVGLLIATALPSSAFAVTITSATCTQQADNVLRYDCTVQTDAAADVWIEFCDGLGCTRDRTTAKSPASVGTTHNLTLYGMKSSTLHEWTAYAHPSVGADDDATGSFTTDDLLDPDQDGTNDPDLQYLTFTMTGAAADVENVLINAACSTGAQKYDYLVIVDADGDIVWYQDPRLDADTQRVNYFEVTGLSLARGVKRPVAVVEHEYVVEYSLEGDLTWRACRDDGGTCPDGTTADAYVDSTEYFHHDAIRTTDGLHFALTAETESYTDTPGCGGTGTWPVIVDGLAAWNGANTRVVDWELSNAGAYGGSISIPSALPPAQCNAGYWTPYLSGYDWAHANSIWVLDKEWTMSLLKEQRIIQVDGDPTHGTYEDIVWEFDGDGSGGDFTLTKDASVASEEFGGLHTAYFGPNPTNPKLLLYDNADVSAAATARGLQVTLDDSLMTAHVDREYPVTEVCRSQGSGIKVDASTNMLVSCSDNGVPSTYFSEVNASESTVWKVVVSCSAGSIGTGIYRAFPVELD